jgi:hypothetical protein
MKFQNFEPFQKRWKFCGKLSKGPKAKPKVNAKYSKVEQNLRNMTFYAVKFQEILGNFGKFWEILGNFGKFWEILLNFVNYCKILLYSLNSVKV